MSADTGLDVGLRIGDGIFEFQPDFALHPACRQIRCGSGQDDADREHGERRRGMAGEMEPFERHSRAGRNASVAGIF